MSILAHDETSILSRVIQPDRGDLPPEAATAILRFEFDPLDRTAMRELVEKNQTGEITATEEVALENYRHVGRILDLLRSKARRSLRAADAVMQSSGIHCDARRGS